MRKRYTVMTALAIMAFAGLVAFAGVNDVPFTKTIALSTAATNQSFVARGELSGVELWLTTPIANVTGTVTVVYNNETIFTGSTTNRALWYPMSQASSTAGALLNYTTALTETNRVFVPRPVAGVIQSTILQGAATSTNEWNVKFLFKQ